MFRSLRLIVTTAALLLASAAGAEPTRIYIDFGGAWELQKAGLWELGTHECDGLALRACGGQTSYLDQAGLIWGNHWVLPPAIMPLWYELQRNSLEDPDFEGIDYDGSGANDWDVLALAADIVALVEEFYAPFDVEVVVVESETLEDVKETLASTPTNDAYIFVGGQDATSSGRASFDWGNQHDNIGFAWAGNAIGMAWGQDEYSVHVESIARTIAHEAGHTFGLAHTGTNSAGVHNGDFMSHFGGAGARVLRYPVHFADEVVHGPVIGDFQADYEADQGVDFEDARQHSFQVLRDVLGLRPNAPAYVTGTGLHDSITISSWWGSWAYVTIKSYTDPERTDLAHSYSYFVVTSNGVYVEAGPGDDAITIHGDFETELHGGTGDDTITGGSGPDVLVGGRGDDRLLPRAGDDVIRWDAKTARVMHGGEPHDDSTLGLDTLRDGGGSDTLDFDEFPERVVVDLGETGEQVVDQPSTHQLLVPICFFPCEPTPTPAPRLRIALEETDGEPGFENVVGSDRGDDITGTPAANYLHGGAGNDTIEGGGGIDTIVGGPGTDTCTNAGTFILCDGKLPIASRPSPIVGTSDGRLTSGR